MNAFGFFLAMNLLAATCTVNADNACTQKATPEQRELWKATQARIVSRERVSVPDHFFGSINESGCAMLSFTIGSDGAPQAIHVISSYPLDKYGRQGKRIVEATKFRARSSNESASGLLIVEMTAAEE